MIAFTVLLLIVGLWLWATPAKAGGAWHTTTMTWYGPGFYGHRTACGQVMTRRLIGVAAHVGVRCGPRIEIRTHHHDRIVRVVDHCGCAPGSDLDATARLMIHLTNHHPHTLHDVKYRVVH